MTTDQKISPHHFALMANDVQQIFQPLERVGIHLFSYRKTFADGSRINVSNNAKWIEDYYQLNLYQSSLFENSIDLYATGFSLWPHESDLPVFTHGRDYYNSDNGITYIVKNDDYCEFFIFGADKNNKKIINFYINNLDLIKKFAAFFQEKSRSILKAAMNNLIVIPPVGENSKHRGNTGNTENIENIENIESLQNYNSKIDSSLINDLFTESSVRLTKQENNCLKGILEGKSAKVIARELGLSFRTVEYYIDNIKKKSGCRNRFEILKNFS